LVVFLTVWLTRCKQCSLAFGLRGADEVNASVDAPGGGDAQCQQRLLECSQAENRADQVEGYADNVGEQTEAWNEQVADYAVVMAPVVGNDAQ
jgi:hypothetical protein